MVPEGGIVPQSDSDESPAQIGRYEIKALKEESKMARVYEAYDPARKRPVALKQLRPNADSEARERFRQEIAINRGLKHFAIVEFYEAYPDEALPYFTMKLMAEDLAHRLEREGPLGPAAILPILERVTEAVDYAHKMGVSHRDIKPANILFDAQGNAYLSDFGIADKQFVPEHDDATDFHPPQFQAAGTLDYMSREQLLRLPVGHPSDIFSLGVVLFEMLSGTRPFGGDRDYQIDQRANDQTALKQIQGNRATKPFESVLSRALGRDEERRQPSGRELYDSFERTLSASHQRQTWYRWGALGLSALALLVAVMALLWDQIPLPPARPTPVVTVISTEPIAIIAEIVAVDTPDADARVPVDGMVTPLATPATTAPPAATGDRAAVGPGPTADDPLPTPAGPSVAPAPPTAPRVTTTERARVRSGPSRLYGVITVLLQGIEATVLGRAEAGDGQWYNIELDDGRRGWISELVVLLTGGSPAEIPLAATIPAPPPTVPVTSPAPATTTPPPTGPNLTEDTPTPAPRPTNTTMPEPPTETPIPEGGYGYGYGYGGYGG